jgi:hypothetical protein
MSPGTASCALRIGLPAPYIKVALAHTAYLVDWHAPGVKKTLKVQCNCLSFFSFYSGSCFNWFSGRKEKIGLWEAQA